MLWTLSEQGREESDDGFREAVVPGTSGPFLQRKFPAFHDVRLIDSFALESRLLVVDVSVYLIVYVETAAVNIS